MKARTNRLIWNAKQNSDADSDAEEIQNDPVPEAEVPDENPNDVPNDGVEEKNTAVQATPNHEKFANRQNFQTRYGRTVKFTDKNQVHYIEAVGRQKPTPKFSNTVKPRFPASQ